MVEVPDPHRPTTAHARGVRAGSGRAVRIDQQLQKHWFAVPLGLGLLGIVLTAAIPLLLHDDLLSPRAPVPDNVYWSGQVHVSNGGIDLDHKPAVGSEVGADLRKDEIAGIAPGPGASITMWSRPGKPTPRDCMGEVGRLTDISTFDPPAGAYMCVRTSGGRIARVTYLGGTGFDIIVWELRA
ncbi:hypothetical protein [Actinokineospora enzanensis]|uniref:hypothetical protein n=1 Tax=Actinokineospora enzanensis TaxID=155975 RepID=UPI0012EB2D94|nr:hypothetical protein [Actinokineospora enzanensis]